MTLTVNDAVLYYPNAELIDSDLRVLDLASHIL